MKDLHERLKDLKHKNELTKQGYLSSFEAFCFNKIAHNPESRRLNYYVPPGTNNLSGRLKWLIIYNKAIRLYEKLRGN